MKNRNPSITSSIRLSKKASKPLAIIDKAQALIHHLNVPKLLDNNDIADLRELIEAIDMHKLTTSQKKTVENALNIVERIAGSPIRVQIDYLERIRNDLSALNS